MSVLSPSTKTEPKKLQPLPIRLQQRRVSKVRLLVPCRWCSGLNTVGIFLTFLFVPEPLRVPLAELDRRYAYSAAGKVYHGARPVSAPALEPGALQCLRTLASGAVSRSTADTVAAFNPVITTLSSVV